jgi:hypothetical protein
VYLGEGGERIDGIEAVLPDRERLQFFEILQATQLADVVGVENESFQLDEVRDVFNFLNGATLTSILLLAKFNTCKFLLPSSPSIRPMALFSRCSSRRSDRHCRLSIFWIRL